MTVRRRGRKWTVTLLWIRALSGHGDVQSAASKLSLDVTASEIRQAGDIAPVWTQGSGGSPYVASDTLTNTNRIRINTLALVARLPTVHGNREHIETGRSLISYAANYPDLFRRAGDYVDKSLRGGPAISPVEQCVTFR